MERSSLIKLKGKFTWIHIINKKDSKSNNYLMKKLEELIKKNINGVKQ